MYCERGWSVHHEAIELLSNKKGRREVVHWDTFWCSYSQLQLNGQQRGEMLISVKALRSTTVGVWMITILEKLYPDEENLVSERQSWQVKGVDYSSCNWSFTLILFTTQRTNSLGVADAVANSSYQGLCLSIFLLLLPGSWFCGCRA